MPLQPDKLAARRHLGIADDALCLALLPGSRGAEVEMLSADFLKTAELLRRHYPALEIVVPLVNARRREQFEKIKAETAPELPMHLLDGQGREAMMRAMPHSWRQALPHWSACWQNAQWSSVIA